MSEMRRFSRVICLGLVVLVGFLMSATTGFAGQKVAEDKPPAYAANKPDFDKVFKHPQSVMNASKLNLKVGDKTGRNVAIAGTMKRSKVAKVRDAHDAAIGVSIWLPGNPDIFTVSWDCYKFDFAMEYAALTDTSNALMSQSPGYKAIKTDIK